MEGLFCDPAGPPGSQRKGLSGLYLLASGSSCHLAAPSHACVNPPHEAVLPRTDATGVTQHVVQRVSLELITPLSAVAAQSS
jgi:hypothetical protein